MGVLVLEEMGQRRMARPSRGRESITKYGSFVDGKEMVLLLLYCKMISGWGGKSIILKLRGENDKERLNRLKVVLLQGLHRKGSHHQYLFILCDDVFIIEI